MKTYKILCLLLTALLLLCACGGTSETSQNGENSSTPEESVTEKAPVRYTYAEEATVYDVSDFFRESYRGLYYIGGNTVIFSKPQEFGSLESPIMVMYDFVAKEYKQSYNPKDDLEQICTYFLGVRENGEFGLASGYGESVWFDKDGNYLGFDLWFDTDDISPAYHELIEKQSKFFDNGENLICYYDTEKSIPDVNEYYTMFDRTTGEKSEFLTWSDYATDGIMVYYNVQGFLGKNRILYERHTVNSQNGVKNSYTLHLRDLTTGEETVIDTGDVSYGGMFYLRETEGGCLFVIQDRRWLKTMFLSEDGTVTQVGESYTAVVSGGEISYMHFDNATKTIAVLTQEEEESGDIKITLLDADTLMPYDSAELSFGQGYRPIYLSICRDGTVQAFARNMDEGMLMLWRTA